jgi:N-methylhydantoinase B
MALKMLLDPHTPINGGCMNPVQITVTPGTILSAEYPAPVVGRSLTGHQIQPVLFQALAAALPERVCAVSCGPIWSGRFYWRRSDGSPLLALSQLNGGMGARAGQDGVSALSFPGNVATIPTEVFEAQVPLLVERKGLICDSGGPGQCRGGLGQEFRVRVLDELDGNPTVAVRADRTRNPALGMLEGWPGRRGRVLLNGSENLHPKRAATVSPGDVISLMLPGGGGYGDPLARSRERVLADVRDGFVSAEAAERDYGVVGID